MRMMLRLFLCFLLAISVPAAAGAQLPWRVENATRQVMYTLDRVNWLPVRKGMVVPDRAWISTGPKGRVQLVRASERLSFRPNTLASVVDRSGLFSRRTEVIQQVGVISLEIEKRKKPHTTIQTPFLAAVVKGTTFTVSVGTSKARVDVDSGLVEVRCYASGDTSNIGAGQVAEASDSGLSVAGEAETPVISPGAPAPAPLAPIDAAALTSIMNGEPTFPQLKSDHRSQTRQQIRAQRLQEDPEPEKLDRKDRKSEGKKSEEKNGKREPVETTPDMPVSKPDRSVSDDDGAEQDDNASGSDDRPTRSERSDHDRSDKSGRDNRQSEKQDRKDDRSGDDD